MRKATFLDKTIAAASLGFIAVLAVSAYWDTSIVWLHVLQSLMYVATIVLVLRHNRWGYFLGFSIAAFWNYAQFFVTSFLRAGLQQLSILVHTGTLPRPDLFISVPAVAFHFVMIVCCALAYPALSGKRLSDIWRFLFTFAASTAYFAAIMALAQPRYLGMFPRMLHPELHL
jgi:hypothetical protein